MFLDSCTFFSLFKSIRNLGWSLPLDTSNKLSLEQFDGQKVGAVKTIYITIDTERARNEHESLKRVT